MIAPDREKVDFDPDHSPQWDRRPKREDAEKPGEKRGYRHEWRDHRSHHQPSDHRPEIDNEDQRDF